MSQNFQTIADWMIFQKPLYMVRMAHEHTRSGVNFIVQEANENQNRKWLAFNFVDKSEKPDGIEKFTHRILVGRHKLLTKINQLKYSEDFYASLNNHKIENILGPQFSSVGGQWIQINGVDGMHYAWLVHSPWGKIWISRLAILCLAVSTMDNFTTSDVEDQSMISFKERPQPMQTLSASNLHFLKQGDLTIKDNHTIVSSRNPTRKFKSDSIDWETQQTFRHLYGLEQYAAVRGDDLWNPDEIGQTLGRTAITGFATLFAGGGLWGFGASAINQEYNRSKYLSAGIPEKIKQQCEDLYNASLIIIEIAKRSKDANLVFTTNKLMEAVDDFRKTIPGRFLGKDYDVKSFYHGPQEEVRKRYRGVFAQISKKEPESSENKQLGISNPEDQSLLSKIDIDRLPESAALGVKTWLTKSGRLNPNSWLAAAVPMLTPHLERALAIHDFSGVGVAIDSQSKHMREILGEIRVLTREFDKANNSQLYQELELATNIINSFLSKVKNNIPEKQQKEELIPNYKEIPGVEGGVYP